MYDNNNSHQAFYPNNEAVTPVKPQKEKIVRKKNSVMKVIAMVMAVVVVGGGAGFGGAYFAARALTNKTVAQQENKDDGHASDNNSGNGNAASSPSGVNDGENHPTLNELQSGVTITHKVNPDAEFNSDGSFLYTRDLVSAVRDSIVYIEVYADPYAVSGGYGFGYGDSAGSEPVLYGAGSGIIVSGDGYIITNAHVVDGMVKYVVHVTTTDPVEGTGIVQEYEASIIGSDTDSDLAVLKIDAKDLQAAVLGDSDELHLGDNVVIIGNPMGLQTSVAKGIVSGLNRELSSGDWSLPSIQTDAGINSGNSGGAMFNMYGEVVGVVNAKLVNDYAEGLGFAITINEAKQVIDDLISMGYVTGRPILGVTCLEVSEYVAAIRGMTPGLYIAEIDQNLAVADSELLVGDTVVAVDGISVTSVSEVSQILADSDKRPGDTVTVTVVRVDSIGRDKEVQFDIVLSEYNGS